MGDLIMADFDFVVVGSGMSGGWVAKELCERGFKVAVVERGRDLVPEEDYTDFLNPWEMEHLNWKSSQDREDYPIQSEVYAFHSYTKQFWVKDGEHPYETAPGTRYKWRRGHHVGGRSIMWARQSYRMSEIDFQANAKDGYGVDWPVRYDDLKEWYDYAETFAGISGNDDGIEVLPSGGTFQPPHEMTHLEKEWKKVIEAKWPTRKMIIGRAANLTQPTEEQLSLGRGQCQARDHCFRGCSFGAYFSSKHATLPAAERTGNMTLIADMAIHEVIYDADTNRATGVRGVNTKTMEATEITARAVFLNASTIPTAMILLNSKSESMPNGLANSSGHVGHNLIGHVGGAWARGTHTGFQDSHHFGRRPNGIYIPRYRNHTETGEGYLRGFGFQGGATRMTWGGRANEAGIGADMKDRIRTPGPWRMWLGAFGETMPRFENKVTLHSSKTDKWGLPIPVMDCRYTDNEVNAVSQAAEDAKEMMEAMGAVDVISSAGSITKDTLGAPGNGIHEMGTCRMGQDPATSVLNKWNQSHDVPNLFVSDGSFMTSAACQNPSLTYMAFSARAANHAADLMESGAI
ncbi:GMC family oxidoreductase [Algimonas ampicilliniresistens]|uniref:GMC family oxidoreductase n=1 Tax=Algimonas ampicilliniresistens TaxID=1298735 RepID=A0ABQ5V4W4_9PROT|nr:GMC family oxidoreductase [Algimonas ampicilliniresistens]GLQ22425.1 GMC family oxidoreductase [Algimonas ampicilliniresistens]